MSQPTKQLPKLEFWKTHHLVEATTDLYCRLNSLEPLNDTTQDNHFYVWDEETDKWYYSPEMKAGWYEVKDEADIVGIAGADYVQAFLDGEMENH